MNTSEPMGTPETEGIPGKNPGHLKPGDEATAGTEGTGEDICPSCSGTGIRKDGAVCPTCEGTGHITQGIGGG